MFTSCTSTYTSLFCKYPTFRSLKMESIPRYTLVICVYNSGKTSAVMKSIVLVFLRLTQLNLCYNRESIRSLHYCMIYLRKNSHEDFEI